MGEIAPLACGRDAAAGVGPRRGGAPARRARARLPPLLGRLRRGPAARRRGAPPGRGAGPDARAGAGGRPRPGAGAARSRIRPEEALRLDSPLGPNRLARAAAATALRAVVDAMDGMRARSCRITQPGPDTATTSRSPWSPGSAWTWRTRPSRCAGRSSRRASRRWGCRCGASTSRWWTCGRRDAARSDAAVTSVAAAAARQVPGVVAARADLAAELVRVTISVRSG